MTASRAPADSGPRVVSVEDEPVPPVAAGLSGAGKEGRVGSGSNRATWLDGDAGARPNLGSVADIPGGSAGAGTATRSRAIGAAGTENGAAGFGSSTNGGGGIRLSSRGDV